MALGFSHDLLTSLVALSLNRRRNDCIYFGLSVKNEVLGEVRPQVREVEILGGELDLAVRFIFPCSCELNASPGVGWLVLGYEFVVFNALVRFLLLVLVYLLAPGIVSRP